MQEAKLAVKGTPISTTKTAKGNYIHKFLCGDKVIKIHSGNNGLKPGEPVTMFLTVPDDAKFPMTFEDEDNRKYHPPGQPAK